MIYVRVYTYWDTSYTMTRWRLRIEQGPGTPFYRGTGLVSHSAPLPAK